MSEQRKTIEATTSIQVDFAPGNVVRLRSGGTAMVVTAIMVGMHWDGKAVSEVATVEVVWMNNNNDMQKAMVKVCALIRN